MNRELNEIRIGIEKLFEKSFNKITPLRIISAVFLTLVVGSVIHAMYDYQGYRDNVARVNFETSSHIIQTAKETVENSISSMISKDFNKIVFVDTLFSSTRNELLKHYNIEFLILHPPSKSIPVELVSTPEKVDYWLKTGANPPGYAYNYTKKDRLLIDFLINRENANHDDLRWFEVSLDFSQYTQTQKQIETFEEISDPSDRIRFFKEENKDSISIYASVNRTIGDCAHCHGYEDGDPIYFYFHKDMSSLNIIADENLKSHLKDTFFGFSGILLIYGFSYIIIRKSVFKQSEDSRFIEESLNLSSDLLENVCHHPKATPYFCFSDVYNKSYCKGGGDSIHFITYQENYFGICSNDVSGHNIKETLLNIFTTVIANSCKTDICNEQIFKPSQFLKKLNSRLLDFTRKTIEYKSHFVASSFLLCDYEKREITLSLAGQHPPLLIRGNGNFQLIGKPGIILGQFFINELENKQLTDTHFRLENPDLLLIYSDGLIEQQCNNMRPFKNALLKRIIPLLSGKTPIEAHRILSKEFEELTSDVELTDDVTFMFVGTRPTDKALDYNSLLQFSCQNSPALNKLSEQQWSHSRIQEIKYVFDQFTQNINHINKDCWDECKTTISYALYDDILEIEFSCSGKCIKLDVTDKFYGKIDLSWQWKEILRPYIKYIDGLFYGQNGKKIWVLFKKQ